MRDLKPITISELRDYLKRFPDDMIVVTEGYREGYERILLPEIIEVKHEPKNMHEYCGEYRAAEDNEPNTINVVAIFRNMRD